MKRRRSGLPFALFVIRLLILGGVFVEGVATRSISAQDLRCLDQPATLDDSLKQQIDDALDRRLETYETLKSPEQIKAYQDRLQDFFVRQLGGFPEETPLNASTVRTIDADGYRIENVIFESRPHHHITANFYIPDGVGPFPGVVVASGHSRTAKTADYNQRFGIMLARNGIAALCFDPIGQGERSQILNEDGENAIPGTTTEHFLVGVGSILVGRNTAAFEVWDSMRCVDYLLSRKEIIPDKIGMTGCSGGGTQTSYAMALDPRIACAAPACYLTTFRRLVETIGPQDAEQNIFGQLAFGMDQPDYVLMRAPKPTLISSTTQDFFDIRGSWENFRQAKRIYGKLGLPERVDLVEIEGKHGVTPQNLATITHWFSRWLLDADRPVEAVVLEPRPAEELLCTPRGQVLLLEGEQSVFDLNAAHATELADRRRQLRANLTDSEFRAKVRETLNAKLDPDPARQAIKVGTVMLGSHRADKYVLRRSAGVPLPMLFVRPDDPNGEVLLCLSDGGKEQTVGDPQVLAWLEQGYSVLGVDLGGQGETSSGREDDRLTQWKTFYLGYLLGRHLVGMRTEDTLEAARFASTLSTSNPPKVHLRGVGRSGIVAKHAAALSPDLFSSVHTSQTRHDWSSLVGNPLPDGQLDHVVHGALEVYDLPDLFEASGSSTVWSGTEPGWFTAGIEGPACDREGNLYAVSFGDSRTIGRVSPDGTAEAWVQLPEGSAGNGIRFDKSGQMYVADYTGHNILKIDPMTKRIRVFAHEPKMHQPNDLAIADDGTLYASDPDWGAGEGALWRIATSGEVTLLGDHLGTTNGIEVSPDGKTLYVAESRQRRVLAYDVNSTGITGRRILIEFDSHSLDGMRCDVDGNLYLTRHGAGEIVKLSAEGQVQHVIDLPGTKPSNLCFGGPDGRTVYVTEVDRRQILRFRVDRPGLSWQRWQD